MLQDQQCSTDGLGARVGLRYFLRPGTRSSPSRSRSRSALSLRVISLLVLERNRAEVLRLQR